MNCFCFHNFAPVLPLRDQLRMNKKIGVLPDPDTFLIRNTDHGKRRTRRLTIPVLLESLMVGSANTGQHIVMHIHIVFCLEILVCRFIFFLLDLMFRILNHIYLLCQ